MATTATATSKTTIQGCLTGTTGSYKLTAACGMMGQVQGDEWQLCANLNKEVEVTGTIGGAHRPQPRIARKPISPSARQQRRSQCQCGQCNRQRQRRHGYGARREDLRGYFDPQGL